MKAASLLWAVMVAVPSVILGQTTAESYFNPISASQAGFHLYGVSVYSGYYSSGGLGGFGAGGFETAVQNPFLTGPSAMAGIAATLGGSKSTEKSTFTWSYSPSYFNLFYGNHQFSDNGSLNHRLGVNWSGKLGSKWTLSASMNGFLSNLQQLYFNPGLLSNIASLPTSFDDLSAGMLAGKFTDAQLASLLTGAPLQASSPQQGYLYGNRMFNVATSVALAWAPSERTSFSLGAAGSRVQSISGVGTIGGTTTAPAGSFLPQMTTASLSLSWSHSFSARTQIGATLSSSRTFSALERGFASSGNVSIGRTMSRRWFLQAQAGAGKLNYSQHTYAAPTALQYIFGGSIGFKTETHTFLLSYNRSLGDAYGLGSGSTSAATGTWNWRRPGGTWSVSAGGGYQELYSLTFRNTRSWVANARVAKSLGPHFSMSAGYMYFQFPSNVRAVGADSSEDGVSVGLTWSLSQYR